MLGAPSKPYHYHTLGGFGGYYEYQYLGFAKRFLSAAKLETYQNNNSWWKRLLCRWANHNRPRAASMRLNDECLGLELARLDILHNV